MKATYTIIAVVIVILAGVGVWYLTKSSPAVAPVSTTSTATTTAATNLGTYAYECDEHVTLTMTIAGDANSVIITPGGAATYPPAGTLTRVTSASGNRFEGQGVVMTAKGETVTLGEGDSAINCSPVADPSNAPFNWGD